MCARVTGEALVSGGESINATNSYLVVLDPGFVVTLEIEKCLQGRVDCDKLTLLVGHSPSLELGIRNIGQVVEIGISRATEPTELYQIKGQGVQGSRAPDVSRVEYKVTRQ